MNALTKLIAIGEALWASHHVHLAPEPEGDRHGTVGCTVGGTVGAASGGRPPLRMAAVGDSMVAGCGVDDQSEGFVPDLARVFAERLDRPVTWEAHGRLGATMRRVRYRLLPEVEGHPDLLVVIAGSNDIMARRSVAEWEADLTATLEEAKAVSEHVVVFSCGQLYNSPALGGALRKSLRGMVDAQVEASRRICERYGACYVDMAHEDVNADDAAFYASDHFHPGAFGYRYMAERSGELLDGWLAERFR
ncbi:SGNH/GDSL hydrolase family protein [Bifidobacterium simiarum]|uniref:SGNH/GDSL hydrolase family protein n=1 Tax=Bifidobacterium simiarum TaxID=2045441 RepID=UPI001BDC6F17|nr:SGNH/GDSL hydrolase family protein [Bifidobacterium simiarum]MBT1165705.1 SGNH/GDSL hydrolase family protein [Bifidobacterium simiarum]